MTERVLGVSVRMLEVNCYVEKRIVNLIADHRRTCERKIDIW
jgi:hypothetical protein